MDSLTVVLVVLCAVLGLAIGSFLNVVIWRVPRNESVVHPPSHCPRCDHPIRQRDNVPVLSWLLLRGRAGTLLRIHWPLHLLRGVLGVGMIAGFVYGLARMPLSTAYAIAFASPLMVTALAVPLLGEKVGPRRWTAIALGVIGVLVVLRPSGEGIATLAGLAVVGGTLCYAIASITVRAAASSRSGLARATRRMRRLTSAASMTCTTQRFDSVTIASRSCRSDWRLSRW